MRIKSYHSIGILFVVLFILLAISCSSQIDESYASQESGTDDNYSELFGKGNRSYNPNTDSWTLMFYLAGDNTLDSMLVQNVKQLVQGYCGGMKAVLLIDRDSNADSKGPFGEVFTTTRLYSLTREGLVRLYGNDLFPELSQEKGDCELDTADATILRNFIRYSKTLYPAEHYGLIIGSHGGGVRIGNQNARAIVQDVDSYNDWIFVSEFTDVLTAEECVDVIGFDACFAGNIETIYQLCGVKDFHADYIVASPSEEWSYGWNYVALEALFENDSIEPVEFAESLVTNYHNYIEEKSKNDTQTLTCIKCSEVPAIKNTLDSLSKQLITYKSEVESLRGKGKLYQKKVMHYFSSVSNNAWLQYPYFDLYSLAERIAKSNLFPKEICEEAKKLAEAVDSAILTSYSGSSYTLAKEGATGLAIFFPNGKEKFSFMYNKTYWNYQYWYNALPLANTEHNKCYGSLAFCADGAVAENGIVENWFELLDYWFDDNKNVNGYIP